MPSAEILSKLQKFLNILEPTLRLEEMLTNVAYQLVEMFDVGHSGIMLFGQDDVEGKVIAEFPLQGAVGVSVPLKDHPLFEHLKVTLEPIAVWDAQNDPTMEDARETMRNLGIHSILIVPLIVRGELVGSLGLDATEARRNFTVSEIEFVKVVGKQVAVAIDYTRTLTAAESNWHQAQTLREINRILSHTLNLDEILPLILEQLQKVIPVDDSSIYLLTEDKAHLRIWASHSQADDAPQTILVKDLWTAHQIVETKTSLLISDTETHPHWRTYYEDKSIKSWLGVPLVVRGEVVGILNINGYSAHQFDETHVSLSEAFANQAAMAIHNARLYGQAKKRAALMASVQKIGLGIMASLESKDVLQAVATSSLSLLDADHVRLYLYDAQLDSFTLTGSLNKTGTVKLNIDRPRHDGLTARVARSGQYMAVYDTTIHPLYKNSRQIHRFRAIVGIPLKKQEEVLGVLNVFYKEPHYFTTDEIDLLQLLTTQAAVALENARLYNLEQIRLQDEARRTDQWRKVQEITSVLNTTFENLDKVLYRACEQFIHLIEVDCCQIVALNNDGKAGHIVAEAPLNGGEGESQIPLDVPAFQQMFIDQQPFTSFRVEQDRRLGKLQEQLTIKGIKSILVAPLIVQGQVSGFINLMSTLQHRFFSEEELNITHVVADQIATAIVNAHNYQAERKARVQADTLREVAAVLGGTLDLDQVLERILVQLKRVIAYESSSIILREKENRFRVVATRGFPDPDRVERMSFAFSEEPHFQEIARTRLPVVIPDTREYEHWQPGPTEIRSWIGAPLMVSDKLIGLLTLDHSQPDFYNQAQAKLVIAFADLAAIALENARLYEFEVKQVEQELHIARQIQRGFFPERIPKLPGWEIAAICLPARETGGDFYEFVVRSDELIGIVVGDVSGKSIPAAMLMAAAQSVVRAKGSDYHSPAVVMMETNQLLYEDVPKGSFVAMSYALFSPENNQVILSSGGQLAPFLVPADSTQSIQLVEVSGFRLPVGVVPSIDYEESWFTLAPGDLLVFHTDGLVERKDKADNMFGFEGVQVALEKLRGQSPEVVLQALLQAADEFAKGVRPPDDVTLVIVQRC